MTAPQMSATEILEQAKQIREAADKDGRAYFSAEDGEILRLAGAIEEGRRRSGITGALAGFVDSIIGERQAAENRLEELRQKEQRVEELLREQAGAKSNVEKAVETLARVEGLAAHFKTAGSPAGIREIFQKKAWAISENNFAGHALEAARDAAAAKILADNAAHFVEVAKQNKTNAEAHLGHIESQLSKFRK